MKTIAMLLATIVVFAACAPAANTQMQKVDSSFIEQVGYDASTQTMVVQMQNSTDVYTYEGVPESVYEAFMASDSKGRYFVENIKGQYRSDQEE